MSAPSLPVSCDVLVVGAGPAGSACAIWLARAGQRVMLVDAQTFPRDKVCGDGLIPDAHAALQHLGVLDEVMAAAHHVGHVACIAPRGGRVDVPGTLAVLPRRQLDEIVRAAAVRAGASFHAPWRFEAPRVEHGRDIGARLKSGDQLAQVDARWVVLATGAVPQALIAADMCTRRLPTGIALRGYVKNPAMTRHITEMEVVWHNKLRPGYGWIFPCGDAVFNIGAGVLHSHNEVRDDGRAGMKDVNLRDLLKTFAACYAPARELMAGGTMLGDLKGAPLRCTLEGARWSRPGLLVTGEAAGSTYAFTGEGIGKAMETGILAAQTLLAASADGLDDAAVCARYDASLAALKPRFDLYERANHVNAHPWLVDLLVWRARRSARLRRRMAGVLNETSNPGHLMTLKGVVRLFSE
ncbi:MAG: NAD(P)/FAD-dependent oxidoreductase [Burkholderiales bacterium]|jgi:geranylgeranyl reductase family protein|nr:NAD(P)/FAD-dependent oxidoreductase [Burkholderiales bacterium]